jgi:4-hydroxy-tetrahydrodipicolinate synthase
VGLSINLLEGLVERNPSKFSGLKDSSGDIEFAKQLGDKFGDELSVFTGNDLLLTEALNNQASGCITAMANLISPELHSLWESFQLNETVKLTQERINHVRKTCEQYQPFPPLIKLLMNKYFDFPLWPVCPPLVAQSEETADQLSTLFNLA